MGGGDYFRTRLERLTADSGMSPAGAERHIFSELVQDAQDLIQRRVADELQPRWQGAEQTFRYRSNAMIEAPEELEVKAEPLLARLSSAPLGDSASEAALSAGGAGIVCGF